mmetsp:Transcript_58541/g.128361  ORF Transcript_58541/g.128361 Transcript_58541/m.128361 type:complete len:833 (+) Transcript_58541:24-2522(+)
MSLTSKRRARHSGGDSSAAPSREASISHDAGFIPAVPSAGITPRRRSNAVIQRKDATPRGRRSMHATELELAPPWWIVRHGGAMHEFMSATLFVLALYGCIAGPWQAAFGDPSRAGGYHILDEVCEAIYLIVAIPGTICTSVHVEAKGTELVSLAALFRIHVRERGFLLDISSFCWRLSALSVDRSPGTVSFTVRSCNFLRLLRLHRILAQGDSSNAVVSGFLGVGKLFLVVLLNIHFTACLWLMVMEEFGGLREHEIRLPEFQWDDSRYPMVVQHTAFIHAGQGSPSGENDAERIFLALLSPAVQMFMSVTFAHLVVLANRMSIMSNRRMESMAFIQAAMDSLSLPKELQARIMRYHSYIQTYHNPDMYDALLQNLPRDLNVEMKRVIFDRLLNESALLQDLEDYDMGNLVQAFEEVVVSPGDCVIACGEEGDSMYFIVKGQVEVFAESGQWVADKKSGDYFGEVALLFPHQVRSAWVIAKTFCVLARLDVDSFNKVFEGYPDKRVEMVRRLRMMGPHVRSVLKQDEVKAKVRETMQQAGELWDDWEDDSSDVEDSRTSSRASTLTGMLRGALGNVAGFVARRAGRSLSGVSSTFRDPVQQLGVPSRSPSSVAGDDVRAARDALAAAASNAVAHRLPSSDAESWRGEGSLPALAPHPEDPASSNSLAMRPLSARQQQGTISASSSFVGGGRRPSAVSPFKQRGIPLPPGRPAPWGLSDDLSNNRSTDRSRSMEPSLTQQKLASELQGWHRSTQEKVTERLEAVSDASSRKLLEEIRVVTEGYQKAMSLQLGELRQEVFDELHQISQGSLVKLGADLQVLTQIVSRAFPAAT